MSVNKEKKGAVCSFVAKLMHLGHVEVNWNGEWFKKNFSLPHPKKKTCSSNAVKVHQVKKSVFDQFKKFTSLDL